MTNDKRRSLTKYAEGLKQRLSSPTPVKHAHRENAYREMLRIDLRKTEKRLNEG